MGGPPSMESNEIKRRENSPAVLLTDTIYDGPCLFANIPQEMKLVIFSYFNAQELRLISGVSKSWAKLAKEEVLWKDLLFYEFNIVPLDPPASYRDFYRQETSYGSWNPEVMRATNQFTFINRKTIKHLGGGWSGIMIGKRPLSPIGRHVWEFELLGDSAGFMFALAESSWKIKDNNNYPGGGNHGISTSYSRTSFYGFPDERPVSLCYYWNRSKGDRVEMDLDFSKWSVTYTTKFLKGTIETHPPVEIPLKEPSSSWIVFGSFCFSNDTFRIVSYNRL